jgi:hypothetical protein
LKKRSKKLLHIAPGVAPDMEAPVLAETDKSFLVLFFKKELLFLVFTARVDCLASPPPWPFAHAALS